MVVNSVNTAGPVVLFGAGAAGRYALKHLRERGENVVCFADNDVCKSGTYIDGVLVWRPLIARETYPDATWIACAISRPAAPELRAQLKELGVKTIPLWTCLPVCHDNPPIDAFMALVRSTSDEETLKELSDQCSFRSTPNYDLQRDSLPASEIYFPDFIEHLDNEHFVDCGACDGDTIELFIRNWDKYGHITAFEPDQVNFDEMLRVVPIPHPKLDVVWGAVGDNDQNALFAARGDYSSHLNPSKGEKNTITVPCLKLDSFEFEVPPTYIKMDIEGFELEALWGARGILKEHKPVLAICAYHTSDHLWQIPLLIHAIQPEYRLFLRRYSEGAFELVWYAVPRERIKEENYV